jgi:hypothetical protein
VSPIFRAEIRAINLLPFLNKSVYTLELRDLAWYKKQRHQNGDFENPKNQNCNFSTKSVPVNQKTALTASNWGIPVLTFLTMSVYALELRDLAWYKKQRHQKAISRVHFFITTTKQSLI